MRFAALLAIAAAVMLAGCQPTPTLEQAQAQCEKKGGLLVVIYTQQITLSGMEPEVATPGDCVSASKFDPNAPAPVPPAPVPAPVTPAPVLPAENGKPAN